MSEVDVRLRKMLDEVGVPDSGSEELTWFLAQLEERYVDAEPPEPGPELAVLLRGGHPSEGTRRPGTRRGRAAAAGVLALGTVLGTGWAAAANELPEPAQRWVAQFSQRYLPFDLPYPTAGDRGEGAQRSGEDGRGGPADAHDSMPSAQHQRPAGSSSAAEVTRPSSAGDDSPAAGDRYAVEDDLLEEPEGEPRTPVREERGETADEEEGPERPRTEDSAEETEQDSDDVTAAPVDRSREEDGSVDEHDDESEGTGEAEAAEEYDGSTSDETEGSEGG